ncbi:superoxide dismutase family protein [Paenibacillus sp. GCM10027626]|uniref:superoxide dismutase family protein n=1 Tax=Paenibacillus sp. GCM10027626 TaxID=3273411 RepID=UPI00362AAFA4
MRKSLSKTVRLFSCGSLLMLGVISSISPAAFASSTAHKPIAVTIINSEGKEIGTATIVQQKNAVQINIKAEKLPPGLHGFHIHETGLCEKPDFKSAGEHLNLTHKHHGFNNPKGFHTGDLPNLLVQKDGTVEATIESKVFTLNDLQKPGGTALVIHEKQDDYVTDPSGNSGNRIACGVIQKKQ